MSFSLTAANAQIHDAAVKAVHEADEVTLYNLARIAKKDGDDERAEDLIKKARQAERANWAYDESVCN